MVERRSPGGPFRTAKPLTDGTGRKASLSGNHAFDDPPSATVSPLLKEGIAVVTRDGTVLATNRVWHDNFVSCPREHAALPLVGRGGNLGEALRSAAAGNRGNAQRAYRALREIARVSEGKRPAFTEHFDTAGPSHVSRCWRLTIHPLCHESDGFLVFVLTDVTDTTRLRETLANKTQQLRRMADELPMLVSYVDAEERYLFNNRAYERFFDVSRDTITGRPLVEMLGEEAYARIRKHVRRVLSGRPVTFSMDLPYKDAGLRHVQASYLPDRDARGRVRGFLAVVYDLTERREEETRIRREQAALAHLARVATLNGLTASVAHELNQPLAAILSNAQAAQRLLDERAPAVEAAVAAISDIVADDLRAGKILREMRALLRRGETKHVPLDLNAVVESVAALVRHEAAERDTALYLRLQPDLPGIVGNRVQLQQVVLNLVLNAFDAVTGPGSSRRRVDIRSSVGPGAGTVSLSVRDHGSKADAGTLGRLFEPFYTTKEEGLGIGLSISRSIVESHGGRLWATRNGDTGLTFHCMLPVDPDRDVSRGHPTD